MAHWWNKTKKKTVLRIRLGRDQGKSRCLVALPKDGKLALISTGLISSPGWEQDCEINGLIDVLATRTPRLPSKRLKALPDQRSVPGSGVRWVAAWDRSAKWSQFRSERGQRRRWVDRER